MPVKRFEVYLVALAPAVGHEIQKTRPCVIVSPDEMNRHIQTVIAAPMTTVKRDFPTRVPCTFENRRGQIVLDQIRTVDRKRLVRNLGKIDRQARSRVLQILQEMFAE